MTLSTKIAIAIALAMTLAGAVLLAALIGSDERARRADFRDGAVEALQLLSLSIAPSVADERHDRVQAVLDNIANYPERFPDIVALDVIAPDGRVVAALDPRRYNLRLADAATRADLRRRDPDARRVGPATLEVVVPVRLTAPLGVVRARASEDRLRAQLAAQRRRVSAAALAAVAAIAMALHLLHRRLVGARLARLAGAAAQLRRGRMNARAEVDGRDEVAQLGEAFNAMAADLAAYTRDLEELVAERTSELRKTNEQLEHLAVTDPLTQLPNRRHFEDRTRRTLEAARVHGLALSVVCVDVDRFKSINDRFGHGVGDQALIGVASTLREAARQGDLVARIGGEEFAVAMPETGADDAAVAAERLRAAVAERAGLGVSALEGEAVTASFGVATFPRHGSNLSELLSAADKALYRAKRAGRNCVVQADDARELAATSAAGSSERSTGS